MILELISIAIPIWIIFFGGAEKIENTFVGYLTHGVFGEKGIYIKVVAWMLLIWGIYDLIW